MDKFIFQSAVNLIKVNARKRAREADEALSRGEN